MQVTSAIVLYAVIWFMMLLIIVPIRIKTQGDLGEIVPGTHAGSPEIHFLKKKIWITTGVSFVMWAIAVFIVVTGTITLEDIDFFNKLN